VGGKGSESAISAIAAAVNQRMQTPVSVVFEDHTWPVEAASVSARLDTETVVAQAMAIGRTGSFADRVEERFLAWFRPIEIRPAMTGDPEALAEVVLTIEDTVERKPKDARVVIDGTAARIESAVVGLAIRTSQFERDLLTAFAEEPREVPVPVDFVPVSVGDSDAQAALAAAEKMMSAPVTVTYESKSWEFGPTDISKWIEFRKVPAVEDTGTPQESSDGSSAVTAEASATPGPTRMRLEAFVDADKTSETVSPKVGETGRPAQDATFRVSNGTVTIVPSKVGTGPDIEALAQQLTRILASGDRRVVELRTMKVEPEVSTEDAEKMGIEERISTYTTTYDASNTPRVNNIHTLADALDGTLIPPGATFSFNDAVGPRTAAKGYQEAPAIVDGKLVPQLGGGICQVGTTIFNTVFESGLPVVERRNHSFYISHYPRGRDATVSWGGPDFKFKNDTEDWVLVATGFSSSSLTVSLYGTDPGYDVTAEIGAWTSIKPHGVEEIEDSTM
ncbi:MAG: VanW family protein, partial [Coriobacteriia bacterium]|nr:VanW family protein [Coriobacteriia bacterium]